MANFKKATFVSLWDGQSYSIETSCLIDENGTISDIEQCNSDELLEVEILDYEYIVIDGKRYEVEHNDDADQYVAIFGNK